MEINGHNFVLPGLGSVAKYQCKDARYFIWSGLQIAPFYVYKGDVISISLEGEDNNLVILKIGIPEIYGQSVVPLTNGENTIISDKEGLLGFVNENTSGNVKVVLNSFPQEVPYFNLEQHSDDDWARQINDWNGAPYAVLSSKRADLILRYNTAKEYIKSAEELMSDFDRFLLIHNNNCGTFDDGRADFKTDPNRALHIEVNTGYMFASVYGYTCYNGDNKDALTRLLRTDNRWGIWHENGHQRQQTSWLWNFMGEVTVNVYSMLAEEEILGRSTSLTGIYPDIMEYLAGEKNNIDDLSSDRYNALKLGMFWQLRLSFGKGFYPQLHQMYRTMDPRIINGVLSNASEQVAKKQRFIQVVSRIAGLNMIPFFKRWGIPSNNATEQELTDLPLLNFPIWENTDENFISIVIPQPEYIPELIYLKSSVSDVLLSPDIITHTLDSNWLIPYKYVLKVNDAYIAEVTDGKSYYYASALSEDGKLKLTYKFNSSSLLKLTDEVEIEVRFNGGVYSLFRSTLSDFNLWKKIYGLFSDSNNSLIRDDLSQDELNYLWKEINDRPTDSKFILEGMLKLYHIAQNQLLRKTIYTPILKNGQISVQFTGSNFLQYNYNANRNNNFIAALVNGNALYASVFIDNVWSFPNITFSDSDDFSIIVYLNNYPYVIYAYFIKEISIISKIFDLYTNGSQNEIKVSVVQDDIDVLWQAVQDSGLPEENNYNLNMLLSAVQEKYLKESIDSVEIGEERIIVTFSTKRNFRENHYIVMLNGSYASEINKGTAYYSTIRNNIWTTVDAKVSQLNNIRVEVRRTDGIYIIYQKDSGSFYDSPGFATSS